jgi:hypothetical protein
MQKVHEHCMTHEMVAFKHPQHLWGAASPDKDEARAAPLEMPEMLDRVCLVARELELSYAACSAGVRIGSPCLVRLLHDAQFLGSSRAVVMQRTPREENFELVRQPQLRTPWPESSAACADAQERRSVAIRCDLLSPADESSSTPKQRSAP